MSEIVIPEIDPDADSLTIALALARADLYVLPTRSDGNAKHAGSVLGKGWPAKSSTDADQIAAWFAGTNHRVAIHCGRSGLIVPDVDHPENLTPELREAIERCDPPFQSTRPDEPGRGHYLFAQPPGRRLGNAAGRTGDAWGEWRGNNGIILVGGPGRRWLRAGPVPVLPDYVADLLPDVDDANSAVSDAEVARFVAAHTDALWPQSLDPILRSFDEAVARGKSRHVAACDHACWIVEEAMQQRFSARPALRKLANAFVDAMQEKRHPSDRTLSRAQAEAEFRSIVAWAVAQYWSPPAADEAPSDAGAASEAPPAPEHDETGSVEAGADDEAFATVSDRVRRLRERQHDMAVQEAVARLRVAEDAKRVFALESVAPPPPVSLQSLTDLLAEQDEDDTFRIEGLWPTEGKVVLAAPQKAGKTTFMGNLVGALADSENFLGRFPTAPLGPGRTVVVLDFEMTRRKYRAWMRKLGIRKTDAVRVELLRGVAWDPRDPRQRREWAERLRSVGCEVLIVDPLGPILHALGVEENDNTGVGRVLNALDALVREAGISELAVVHHTGHNGERSRGAAVLRGWPDAEWRIVLGDWDGKEAGREPPPNVARFFAATGRDVAVPEGHLEFDELTRHLSLGRTNRREYAVDKHTGSLLAVVKSSPGISARDLRTALATRAHIRAADAGSVIAAAVGAGVVHVHDGPRNSKLHYPGAPSDECEMCPGGSSNR